MNLSKDVKDHIIIFNDGSKKMITENQFNAITQMSSGQKDSLVIDGSLIKFHSISKLLSMDEFYEQYPDQRPQQYDKNEEYISPITNASPKATKLMLKGLKQYCDENSNALKAKEMYNQMSKI